MPRIIPTAAAAVVALLVGTACYKVTVITAPEPTNATVVDKPWTHSFIFGLITPGEIDVSKQCRSVSKVVTQHSLLNSVARILTSGIYTPLQVTTTCAPSRTAGQPGIPLERLGYVPPDSTRATGR